MSSIMEYHAQAPGNLPGMKIGEDDGGNTEDSPRAREAGIGVQVCGVTAKASCAG